LRPVFINGRYLAQPRSGVQRFAAEIVAALARVWPLDLGERPVLLTPPGVDLSDTPLPSRAMGRRKGIAWEQIDLPRHAAAGVLVNLGNTAPMAMPGRRQIVVIHDTAPISFPAAYSWRFRAWYGVMQRVVLARGPSVVTVSHFARREIATHLRVPCASIAVIPEGTDHMARLAPDIGAFARLGLEPGRFVLAVGNLAAHKNLGVLGDTAKALAEQGLHLVITGAANKALFGQSGIVPPEPARYVGRVSDGALRALYGAARCFVFPSLYEGFGLPAVEAMACGCPVIVSDIPVLREICGDAARYVDPRSPHAVARGVLEVVTNDDLAARLRHEGRRLAAGLTWDRSAAGLLASIRALMQAQP
jgi:glycosyltransferase involved in cell wall biosynthesis